MEAHAVHFKALEGRQTQIKRDMKDEHNDGWRKAHGWRKEVKADPRLDANRDKYIGMMGEFEYMYDGHLGRMSVA